MDFFIEGGEPLAMSVEELQEFGLAEMTDDEIRRFLSTQKVGVLGLPGQDTPYLIPLSYGYDGEQRLYFTYLRGSSSRKARLSDTADAASFLVYTIDTMYSWESVLLTGTLSTVPESRWDEIEDTLADAWRPDLFRRASLEATVTVYAYHIDERTGIKHQGLPPGFKFASE